MANLHLVTGYAGYEHIKATDQAAFNAALIGTGQFVLEKGGIFEAQVQTNNLVRVLDGELMMQGRFIRLDPDTYVDLEIENGEQGKLRNDIIVARYTKDIGTGVEECNLVVIKGEAVASDPVDPAHEEGDITNGVGTVHDFPLWRIPIDGINVGEPESLFGTPFMDSMHTLHSIREDVDAQLEEQKVYFAEQEALYEAAFEEQNEKFQKSVDAFGGYTKTETLTDETKALYGLGNSGVPDDVFGMFVKHVWKRRYLIREVSVAETPVSDFVIGYFSTMSSSVTITFTYGDSYSVINTDIRDSAEPTLEVAGTTAIITPNGITAISTTQAALVGKYTLITTGENAGSFCYIPEDATITRNTTTKTYSVDSAIILTPSYTLDERHEWGRISSTDSTTYPTGETEDGWEYIYCGVPFDNACEVPAKMVVGQYVGTGVYGSGNEITLTFDFMPKDFLLFGASSGEWVRFIRTSSGAKKQMDFGTSTSSFADSMYHTWGDNTITWYSTRSAKAQGNIEGTTYDYMVIG